MAGPGAGCLGSPGGRPLRGQPGAPLAGSPACTPKALTLSPPPWSHVSTPRSLQKAPPLGEGQGCAGRWPAGHWPRKRRGRGAGMSGDLPVGSRRQACERRSGQGCPAGAEVCGCLGRGHLGLGSGWLVIARLLSRPCQPVRPQGPSGCSPSPSGANRFCRGGKGASGVPGCVGPSRMPQRSMPWVTRAGGLGGGVHGGKAVGHGMSRPPTGACLPEPS